MGEYHTRYIREKVEALGISFSNYQSRKAHVYWTDTANTVHSGIYKLENLIDEDSSIHEDSKERIMDFFSAYAQERANELDGLYFKNKKEQELHSNNLKKAHKQRNILAVLCAVFIALSLLLAVRPTVATEMPSEGQNVSVSAVVNARYVASVNSNKYHLPSCKYAESILPENRVYYATKTEAQAAGKTPCSVCKP